MECNEERNHLFPSKPCQIQRSTQISHRIQQGYRDLGTPAMPWASSWWSSQSFWAVLCPKTNFNLLSYEAGKKLLLTTRLQFSCRHSCSRCSFIKCDCGVPKDRSWESLYCTAFPWVNTCFFAPPAHLGRRLFPSFFYQLLLFLQFISVCFYWCCFLLKC